jgi:putative ABC transport system substrate-binding protein
MVLLVNPTSPLAETLSTNGRAAARALGLEFHILHASTERDFDAVFATLVQLRTGALVIGPDAFFTNSRKQLAALALRHVMHAIYETREFAEAGGLMSYGPSIRDAWQRASTPAGFSRVKSQPICRSGK